MDFKKYLQGGQGGDFSSYMDQYASSYKNYMGQGSGNSGAGDYKQYMDFHRYMQGQSQGGDFSKYMAKYAADYQKFMQMQGQSSQKEGHSQSGHGHASQQSGEQHSSSSSDSSNASGSPALLVADASSQQPDFRAYMGKYADYQRYLQSQGQGSPQGFQGFMGNHTDSFQKFMDARGSEAAGDFGKYFSDFQKYEQSKGKETTAGFQHYMQGYADDYAKYLQLGKSLCPLPGRGVE